MTPFRTSLRRWKQCLTPTWSSPARPGQSIIEIQSLFNYSLDGNTAGITYLSMEARIVSGLVSGETFLACLQSMPIWLCQKTNGEFVERWRFGPKLPVR